jgi:hypothetical protein
MSEADLVCEISALTDERDRLRDELTQTRLDLMNSDAIREAFVKQSCELAKDMARALSMVESAFHAGYRYGDGSRYRDKHMNASDAYNNWTGELKGVPQSDNEHS